MIQLKSIPKPIELTEQKVKVLTETFRAEGKAVWKKPFIKSTLLKMSHNKCCYCECQLEVESKYCEIEHFHPKDKYPQEVLEWSNLLPSCKRCNGTKNNHDTKQEPIIHPVKDIPKNHLYFQYYRFYPKSSLGKTTIQALNLNHRQRLVMVRAKIGGVLLEQLEELQHSVEEANTSSIKQSKKIARKLEGLMTEAIPSAEYSATMSTIILNSESYKAIKSYLIKNSQWTITFQNLEKQIEYCKMDTFNPLSKI